MSLVRRSWWRACHMKWDHGGLLAHQQGSVFFNKGRVCVPRVCVSRSDRHMRHAEPVRRSLLCGLLSEWERTAPLYLLSISRPLFVISIPSLFPRGISFEALKIQLQGNPLICEASGPRISRKPWQENKRRRFTNCKIWLIKCLFMWLPKLSYYNT